MEACLSFMEVVFVILMSWKFNIAIVWKVS